MSQQRKTIRVWSWENEQEFSGKDGEKDTAGNAISKGTAVGMSITMAPGWKKGTDSGAA